RALEVGEQATRLLLLVLRLRGELVLQLGIFGDALVFVFSWGLDVAEQQQQGLDRREVGIRDRTPSEDTSAVLLHVRKIRRARAIALVLLRLHPNRDVHLVLGLTLGLHPDANLCPLVAAHV